MVWNEESLSEELARHEVWLLSTPGVEGAGIGSDRGGELCLKIYTTQRNPELEQQISPKLGALPVDFETTGSIETHD